jgi:anti-anti-sigma factor
MPNFDITLSANELAAILATRGSMDSKVATVFKAKGDQALASEKPAVNIDFKNLETLDASAVGMLMFFSYAGKTKGKTISISNANPAVMQVLNRANLGKVLAIR